MWNGVCTALITPFDDNGIDYNRLTIQLNRQLDYVSALVLLGTTGEASTITQSEREELIEFVVHHVKGRVPVIVGTGSNNTDAAKKLAKNAYSLKADGILVVTPYYNKCTQQGLIEHYSSIAAKTDLPIILYNVPARTNVTILPKTAKALSNIDTIVGIKDCSASVDCMLDMFYEVGNKLDIYCGDDSSTTTYLNMGAKGIVSVLSNAFPKEVVDLVHNCTTGNTKKAAQLQLKLLPIVRAIFSQTNPIGVKSAMASLGLDNNILRLPLTPMQDDLAQIIAQRIQQYAN